MKLKKIIPILIVALTILNCYTFSQIKIRETAKKETKDLKRLNTNTGTIKGYIIDTAGVFARHADTKATSAQ